MRVASFDPDVTRANGRDQLAKPLQSDETDENDGDTEDDKHFPQFGHEQTMIIFSADRVQSQLRDDS